MTERIAFFTAGFAHNRLIRMRFYEKIFPKSVQLYLITTDKYDGKEREKYQQEYDLKRTKIIRLPYNTFKLPFGIRKICREEKIDRLFNLGFHTSAPLLLAATLGTETKFILNILTDVFAQHRLAENKKDYLKELANFALVFPLILMSDKVIFNDEQNYRKARYLIPLIKKKTYMLAAPVNTSLFKIKDKKSARKKLGLPLNKNIMIFVGRISYLKCSDILGDLIVKNPDTQFILIGRMMDERIKNLKVKNLIYFEKKSSQELLDYYNAADIGFNMTRSGGGLGLTTAEALSCGLPVVIPNVFELPKGEAVYQVPYDSEYVNGIVNEYFKLDAKEREKMRKKARKYAEDKYSDNAWKGPYVRTYLG